MMKVMQRAAIRMLKNWHVRKLITLGMRRIMAMMMEMIFMRINTMKVMVTEGFRRDLLGTLTSF